MVPTQDNFLSWWQLRMLIIGQPDKMHRDLNSKRSIDLSATSMRILVSHDNQYVSNLVFSLCMLESLDYTQDTARSLLHAPPAYTSCWHNHNLNACHTTAQRSLQTVSNFTNPILYHHWLCSIIIKPSMQFVLHSGHINRYMHHHSLAQAEPLLYGEI